MSPLLPATLLAVTVLASGCVLHVNPDHDGYQGNHHDVAGQEARNRAAIGRLKLGSTLDQVLADLGEPDFSEAWTNRGQEVRVLRYRTHRTRADGDTTADETTALVFRAGKLVGIGERALAESASG